jgi:two-component system, NarL family, nitrate/nitrite response regulator NarL
MRSQLPRRRKLIRVSIAGRTRMDCQLLMNTLHTMSRSCRVIGCAVSTSEFLSIAAKHHPHVALISRDLEDGPTKGLDLVKEIRDSFPDMRSIILLDSSEPAMVIPAFQVGAKGIFSRAKSIDGLSKCIEVVHRGQIWASTDELQSLMEAIVKWPRLQALKTHAISVLTHRENEVVNFVAQGLRNNEISEKMRVSPHTVKNYLYRIYDKLGVSSRAQLLANLLGPRLEAPFGRSVGHRDRLAG